MDNNIHCYYLEKKVYFYKNIRIAPEPLTRRVIKNIFLFVDMEIKLKSMDGKDFVKKILEGERDFSRIKLENGFNLEGFKDLQIYLHKADLQYYPIILDYAELINIQARRLELPFVSGKRINLFGANLCGADLYRANLYRANLEKANLEGTNLEGTNLYRANLPRANFWGANLRGANFWGANLERANLRGADLQEVILEGANLRGVKNLEKTINLDKVNPYRAKVTEKERAIIDNYSKRSK